jgi:2-phospho-L-lactate guanylyltransferase (CobY/MobA/RfbA family)
MPEDGIAIAPAPDGTTNALALARPGLFEPLYGPGSAARFRAHAEQLGVEVAELAAPALALDVDTVAELVHIAP